MVSAADLKRGSARGGGGMVGNSWRVLMTDLNLSVARTTTVQFRNKHFPSFNTFSLFVPSKCFLSFFKGPAYFVTARYPGILLVILDSTGNY